MPASSGATCGARRMDRPPGRLEAAGRGGRRASRSAAAAVADAGRLLVGVEDGEGGIMNLGVGSRAWRSGFVSGGAPRRRRAAERAAGPGRARR
nr:hypothetical protein KPHV_47640 [Kitasatospora purpeofusca]